MTKNKKDCARLISEFPYIQILSKGETNQKMLNFDNQRIDYSEQMILNDPEVSKLFKKFVKVNLSKEFFDKFLILFKDHILKEYPNFEKQFKPIKDLRIGVSGVDDYSNSDILFRLNVALTTPVMKKPSSYREIHLDNPNKLFSGLFYLRLPGDKSSGGDPEVYEFLKNKKPKFNGPSIDKKYVKKIKTIKYEKNVLVLFLGTKKSLHGVSVRSTTRYPRLFVFFTARLNKDVYDLRKEQGILGSLRYSSFYKSLNKIRRK